MTREEFESLKIGDKVYHPFGGRGIVTSKDDAGYTLRDKGFDNRDGLCDVNFAWNEGKKIKTLW